MSHSSPYLIELRGVTKRFGRQLAVDNLSLQVRQGEIHGLLGHNGAGKSTSIGMMLGQVWPTDGDIYVCGADVTTARRAALGRVGAIFETPVFYDYLSGRHNLEILSTYTASLSRHRIDEVLEWVGLKGRGDARVQTYSHGMRTRLALAQALLPNPQLLILDEPSDGLDPEGIHEMRQTILRLRRELGLTLLLSSHLLTEVDQLCDRITVLRQGRTIFEGVLSERRARQEWVRLKVDDWERAIALLQAKGALKKIQPPGLISLTDGWSTASVVRELVAAGIGVNEIAHHEETLEEFYLSLMNGEGSSSPRVTKTEEQGPTKTHS